ncbi:MAG TPA: DUF4349 domain-containing protein [Acidimicrobiales bacterium]|nr:DUF4349 domain-containing protein [Acidimicrobiales bacterium]
MGATGLTAGGWKRAWPGGDRKRMVALAVALLAAAGAAVAVSDGAAQFSSGDAALDAPGRVGEAQATGAGSAALRDQPAAGVDEHTAAAPVPPAGRPLPDVPPVPGLEPQIVKHADLSIEVAEGSATEAFDRAADVARRRGGFVVSSSTSSIDAGHARAELTLRVPAEQFDNARGDLAGVGELRSVQVSGQDVTAQLVDLDARLRALRAEEDALTALLGEAGSVGEVLAVREQLSSTRLEIEQLAAQQASLEDRAAFSTLRVSLLDAGATGVGIDPEPATGLARSFDRAVHGAVAVAGGMVVVLGYLLPLVVLGLLAWGGGRLIRFRLRRRPA